MMESERDRNRIGTGLERDWKGILTGLKRDWNGIEAGLEQDCNWIKMGQEGYWNSLYYFFIQFPSPDLRRLGPYIIQNEEFRGLYNFGQIRRIRIFLAPP